MCQSFKNVFLVFILKFVCTGNLIAAGDEFIAIKFFAIIISFLYKLKIVKLTQCNLFYI